MDINEYLRSFYRFMARVVRMEGLIERRLQSGWTVLDVGCGRCSAIRGVRKKIHKVGIDMYEPYVLLSRQNRFHRQYVLGNALKLPFKDRSFDCVVATEIIEHIDKESGRLLLVELERVACRAVILTTPNGFLKTWAGPQDNPDETHVCGWESDELQGHGFEVRGLNGLKALWTVNSSGCAAGRFPFISGLLIDLTQLIVYFYPRWAFQLFAIKERTHSDGQQN
jgi:SAM-dependent methyltransferase